MIARLNDFKDKAVYSEHYPGESGMRLHMQRDFDSLLEALTFADERIRNKWVNEFTFMIEGKPVFRKYWHNELKVEDYNNA